jgi:hypothetical protein
MTDTFLWFDLETFGRSPRTSRIAQFAGIRTNAELEVVAAPLMLYCQPALDLLPSPEATLITGISPQQARREGLIEPEFLAAVHEALAEPGTCAVGYNSLRFDVMRCIETSSTPTSASMPAATRAGTCSISHGCCTRCAPMASSGPGARTACPASSWSTSRAPTAAATAARMTRCPMSRR